MIHIIFDSRLTETQDKKIPKVVQSTNLFFRCKYLNFGILFITWLLFLLQNEELVFIYLSQHAVCNIIIKLSSQNSNCDSYSLKTLAKNIMEKYFKIVLIL